MKTFLFPASLFILFLVPEIKAGTLATNTLSPVQTGSTNILIANDFLSNATYSLQYRVDNATSAGQTFTPPTHIKITSLTFQIGRVADILPFPAGQTTFLTIYTDWTGDAVTGGTLVSPAIPFDLSGFSLNDFDFLTFHLTQAETDAIGELKAGKEYAVVLNSNTGNRYYISRSEVANGENTDGKDYPDGTALFLDTTASHALRDTEFYIHGSGETFPFTPTNITIQTNNNRLSLNWDDNNQPSFSHFRISRSLVSGGPYTLLTTNAVSFYVDTAVLNGMTYHYIITAVNGSNETSNPSSEIIGIPADLPNRPNFVFIIADDQGQQAVGAYGNPIISTPNLDRLASEGMRFQNAHHMGSWSGAVCRPSRTMIMTGRTLWRIPGRPAGGGPVPGDMPDHCLAQIFNDAGYDTMRTCKIGNSYPAANARFDVVNDATKREGNDPNGSAWHADRVLDYLQSREDSNDFDPFLIYFGFSHPHDPRHGKPALLTKYGAIDPGPPALPNPLAPPLEINYLPAHPFFHGHVNLRDEVAVQGVGTNRNEATIRNELGKEYACIENIDTQVGRVLQKLEDMGIMDDTYIFYVADHGMAVGRHGLQGKQNLYEHTWRVPFIAKGPGIPTNTVSQANLYLLDVLPTLCELANIPLRPSIDGISFKPVLEGAPTNTRQVVHGVYSGGTKPGMRSVKKGRWKLIKYDVDSNRVQETQLFDLEINPNELLIEHRNPVVTALLQNTPTPNQINLAKHPAYALIRQELEECMMQQRKELEDPYQFLGDRTLLRFEEGTNGQPANLLLDRMPWSNNATAMSGTGGAAPNYTSQTFGPADFVGGETNSRSLDFEQDQQNYLQIPDSRELDFGNEPFTIEAWVQFETIPTGPDAAGTRPLVMKRALAANDNSIDYMVLASAGLYGGAADYDKLALHFGSTQIVSSLSITDTNWHYIGVAFNPVSNLVRFVLDNQTENISTPANGSLNNGPLIIGAHFDNGGNVDYAFDGLLDEVSITVGFLCPEEYQPLAGPPVPLMPSRIDLERPFPDPSRLTFDSIETQLYDLQESSNLYSDAWTTIQSHIGGTLNTNRTKIFFDAPPLKRAYYRIKSSGPKRP